VHHHPELTEKTIWEVFETERPGALRQQQILRGRQRCREVHAYADRIVIRQDGRIVLVEHLRAREAEGLIVTGSETDVSVLATVLGAVDLGYRIIVVRDAICSHQAGTGPQTIKFNFR
jgi:nicotinamidase-related amidase